MYEDVVVEVRVAWQREVAFGQGVYAHFSSLTDCGDGEVKNEIARDFLSFFSMPRSILDAVLAEERFARVRHFFRALEDSDLPYLREEDLAVLGPEDARLVAVNALYELQSMYRERPDLVMMRAHAY